MRGGHGPLGVSLGVGNEKFTIIRGVHAKQSELLSGVREGWSTLVNASRIMRKLVSLEGFHVEQKVGVAWAAICGVRVGDPFAIRRPTDGSGKVIRCVRGEEFALRSSQCRDKINPGIWPSDAHEGNLCSIRGPDRTDPVGRTVGEAKQGFAADHFDVKVVGGRAGGLNRGAIPGQGDARAVRRNRRSGFQAPIGSEGNSRYRLGITRFARRPEEENGDGKYDGSCYYSSDLPGNAEGRGALKIVSEARISAILYPN
jgi:hypothetical protein